MRPAVRPPNRRAVRPPNNSSCGKSPQLLLFGGPVLTVALLNNPGLQGKLAAHRLSPRQSASVQAPSAATVLIGRTMVLQCCALLPACLQFLHTVKHFRIVSYRDILCDIVSCVLWLYRAITRRQQTFFGGDI